MTIAYEYLTRRTPGVHIEPGRLAMFGFFALIVLNILLFCANLFKAMFVMRSAKNEAEVEGIMVPAIKGGLDHLGPRTLGVFRLLVGAGAGT